MTPVTSCSFTLRRSGPKPYASIPAQEAGAKRVACRKQFGFLCLQGRAGVGSWGRCGGI